MTDLAIDSHEPTPAPAPEKPRLLTPFNVIAAIILAIGIPIIVLRFAKGLGATTNLSNYNPWGLWIGFDVVTGVALAAGGYVTSSAVYLFGMKEYKPLARPALLTGFIGYSLVVVGLLVDLGRPWRLPYPFVVSPGVTSPLFEIALCVALYLTVLFIESTPAAFEWLGWKRLRKLVGSLTIALTIFGVVLSTMHQSTLGTLYLITPTKLHPLWYSPHLPIHFFVSSIVAGISMVTVEGMLSHRAFGSRVGISHEQFDKLTLGLGKAGAVVLAVYFCMKVAHLAHENLWSLLLTPMGGWFLVELLGFVALPAFLFALGYRDRKPGMVRVAGLIGVIGVVLNRLNVTLIAFNWQLPSADRYFPSWMEIWTSLTIVTIGVVAFRWIANRMPILAEHPDWKGVH
jgi:Ni/Fe-hydrogenase subunit HybB-like protein